MKKRLTSLVLSIVLAFSAFSPAYADPVPETNQDYYNGPIQTLNPVSLNDISNEIFYITNITDDIIDGIDAAVKLSATIDDKYNIILSSEGLMQRVSSYYDEILILMQPYEELNTAAALLQLTKESLPGGIESPTEEAINSWYTSLSTSYVWLSSFFSVMADVCRKYGI